MDDVQAKLKATWDELDLPLRYGVAAGGALASLVMVFKVLPELIGALGVGLFIALLILPYWIPTIIAFGRSHPSRGAILAVNLLLGWTFIGWVVALVWALSDNASRGTQSTVVVNNNVNTTSSADVTEPVGRPAPPVYKVGDVVNGHQFDGTSWNPLPPSAMVPPQATPAKTRVTR